MPGGSKPGRILGGVVEQWFRAEEKGARQQGSQAVIWEGLGEAGQAASGGLARGQRYLARLGGGVVRSTVRKVEEDLGLGQWTSLARLVAGLAASGGLARGRRYLARPGGGVVRSTVGKVEEDLGPG